MLSRRTVLSAAITLPLAACAAGIGSARRREVRVATLNIWHDMGDWQARRPLLIQALRGADADVIALQEVLQDAAKALANQAETLAVALGGYSVHFVSTDPEGSPRRYGNAILTRLPVLAEDSRKLEPLDDHRTALRVRVQADGRPIDIVNTHLAWQADAGPVRARQIADLLSWLPKDGVPLVVTGDFNAPLDDPGLASLAASPRFQNALPRGAALTTLNPAKGHAPRVIDHIFAERQWFTIGQVGLIAEQPTNGEYPSDHFGLAATLRLR
jgi:endonuclease/exonuclease/phosphatase family metal-dependent hydrolase